MEIEVETSSNLVTVFVFKLQLRVGEFMPPWNIIAECTVGSKGIRGVISVSVEVGQCWPIV